MLDKGGFSPLHWAARSGHLEIAVLLLDPKRKASINYQNKLLDTPLHLAAWGGHVAVVSLLLQHHANTTIKNKDGQTALQLAKVAHFSNLDG